MRTSVQSLLEFNTVVDSSEELSDEQILYLMGQLGGHLDGGLHVANALIARSNEEQVIESVLSSYETTTTSNNPQLALRIYYILWKVGHDPDLMFTKIVDALLLEEYIEEQALLILILGVDPKTDAVRIGELLPLLDHEEASIRNGILRVLSKFPEIEGIEDRAIAALESDDPESRVTAAYALANLIKYKKDREKIEEYRRLLNALLSDESILVKGQAEYLIEDLAE
jgi:hypothetical protein